ncbi:MAG: MqnA/MqnD/SBP family protein [Verrucomicrobiota bacterium]
MNITLGHSPDPDDAFMFYALAEHKIDTGSYEFEHILQDIQTLNERARKVELDVTAVSIHAYATLAQDYALLSSGASMGDNYGPMIVGPKKFLKQELLSKRIAVPGKMTSAFLALQLYLDKADAELDTVVVPFDEIFDALKSGKADVGVIIHEGQLTYADEGFVVSEDLGQWWNQLTEGLPLPLGGNAIRRGLGEQAITELSKILTESISYGLENRDDGVKHALPLGRGLDHEKADRFIGMYVNDLTLDYGERGRKAVQLFLDKGYEAGLIGEKIEVEFV